MDSLHTYGILAEFAPAYCHYHRNNIDPTSGWGYITRDEKMMINILRRSGWTNEALKELQERDLIVDMNERAVISSHQKQRRGSRSRSNSALSSRRPSFAEAAPERRPSFNETSPQRRPSFNETSPQRRQSFTQEASPPRRSSRTSSRSSMQSSLFTPDASEDEIKFDPRVMYSTSTSGDEF